MSLAFVFPGQGSQSVGMLAGLAEQYPTVEDTFAEASAMLGFDLWRLVQDGPKEELDRTENTQPAMLAAGVAIWRVWREEGGPAPTVMTGHSLGEFTALVCSSALSFPVGISLVRFRAEAMQSAVPLGQGAMAAILGLDDDVVQEVCKEAAGDEVCEAVNFNAPGQVVIAGHRQAVGRAMAIAERRGARRIVQLPVTVPSHSSLMKPAAEAMRKRLAATEFRAPLVPEIYTVDVKKHGAPDDVRNALVEQLYKPVRWTDTVRAMITEGVDTIVECGPGRILTGLNRRAERRKTISVFAVDDPESIEKAMAACREAEYV